MNSATGGILNIVAIAFFIVLISGLLAYTVSYNKAFKVKNHVINSIEQCEGLNSCSRQKIEEYIKKIGYNGATTCTNDYASDTESSIKGYCYKFHSSSESSTGESRGSGTIEKGYYEIQARVDMTNITIPFVGGILNGIGTVSGTTKSINIVRGSVT